MALDREETACGTEVDLRNKLLTSAIFSRVLCFSSLLMNWEMSSANIHLSSATTETFPSLVKLS